MTVCGHGKGRCAAQQVLQQYAPLLSLGLTIGLGIWDTPLECLGGIDAPADCNLNYPPSQIPPYEKAKMTSYNRMRLIPLLLVTLLLCLLPFPPTLAMAEEKTLLDIWSEITPPPVVPVQPVQLDPKTSALLILDIEEFTCNAERRPRCPDSVPRIKTLLDRARAKGMAVVYSLTSKGTPQTILPEVRPLGNAPVVQSGVDKFYNTELEKILRERGIKTVILVGTAAEGAVLHTATGAVLRGLQVVVPLDGMTSAALYAEQYTAWHLLNAPGTKGKVTLTLFGLIGF